ncbi:MAG TPA: histidine phosphatase family protein, partial [Steroidobacteraceae bacterium]|nr:histidine phosphatase family protein [Steroidobacteraceae bacterium]
MQLLILRHAIAFPRDAKRWPDDAKRTLTMEGAKRARRAAAGLKRMTKQPTLVLTSPLVRARDTAAIFA